MAVVIETITVHQFSFLLRSAVSAEVRTAQNLAEIWTYHQQIALCSAILSSLWAPVVYYPLNRWWKREG